MPSTSNLFPSLTNAGRRSTAAVLVGLALWAGLAAPCLGQTWDGGAKDNYWSTANNWNPDNALANNGTAAVIFSGAKKHDREPWIDVPWNVSTVTFASHSKAEAFTLDGSLLTIQAGIVNNASSNQIFDNNIALGAAQTWSTASTGTLRFGGGVDTAGRLLTLDASAAMTFGGVISGSGGVTKTGAGTVTFSGSSANTYSGLTTVNAGTLLLAKAPWANAIAGHLVIGGTGTVVLASNNQIANTAAIGLSGGTFKTGGFDETVGTLTLTADSRIDFAGKGASDLHFADSHLMSWTGTLTLVNYNDGSDQLFVGIDGGGLTSGQLGQIYFNDPYGPGSGVFGAQMLISGQIKPLIIPEPATMGGLVLLAAGLFAREYRRWRSSREACSRS